MPDAFHIQAIDTGDGVPCKAEESAYATGHEGGIQALWYGIYLNSLPLLFTDDLRASVPHRKYTGIIPQPSSLPTVMVTARLSRSAQLKC